jgi:hypothetical protein
MSSLKPLAFAAVSIGLALAGALAFESVYDVTVRTRPVESSLLQSVPQPSAPLPLRLVDSGGVGVPVGVSWGGDYSHDSRVFREVILRDAPFVDGQALGRVDRQWRTYVGRMLEYGNNGIVVPLLLELIDFDRVTRAAGETGNSVYGADPVFLARHAAVRRSFEPIFEWTGRQGMPVFLSSDMLALTRPLAQYLQRLAPNSTTVGIDASSPAVWDVYRAGLDELFDALPAVKGVVIRVGEAGSLYHSDSWDYRSEMAVRDSASLRAMLRGLLPLFEARGKTLVLRSWTVGVGPIGRLHTDPRVYDAVLGDIDSPALVVSTKFTAGDFFSHLSLNPTLFTGRHRRIVELQARPEFEGFGAFPDFMGEEHARALRAFTSANPRVIGTYLWTQQGGPLRAGPRSLYSSHGFWLWTDANVFVASRLAVDRSANPAGLVTAWARGTFGGDERVAAAVAKVLGDTRDAVRKGFYIRPFAEHEVRIGRLELPPLLWIFDWNKIGGWHSLLSLVYRGAREQTGHADAIAEAIEDGDAAARGVRRARQELQSALTAVDPNTCARICDEALRSLEYQETLFDVLAAWRQAFLSYYRWLETGDRVAWTQWTAGRERFESAASRHLAHFGGDPEFPAFDLTSAKQAMSVAARSAGTRTTAAALLLAVAALLSVGAASARQSPDHDGWLVKLGRTAWTAGFTPWRLAHVQPDLPSAAGVTAVGLVLAGFLAGALSGFTTVWISAGSFVVIASAGLGLEGTTIGSRGRGGRGRLLVTVSGPLIPWLLVLLGIVAYHGPLGFWYRFWTASVFRVSVITIAISMMVWTAGAVLAARPASGWFGRIGGSLAAAGVAILAVTAMLPGWVDVLRFLDRPLNFAPATETMLIALRTYAGVSLATGLLPWLLGAVLVAFGFTLSLRADRVPRNGQLPSARV